MYLVRVVRSALRIPSYGLHASSSHSLVSRVLVSASVSGLVSAFRVLVLSSMGLCGY